MKRAIHMRERKAQLAVEFIILIGISFIILVVYFSVASDLLAGFSTDRAQESLENTAFNIQREFLIAQTVHDGYERHFTIPQRSDSFNYSITSTQGYITLTFKSATITTTIPNVTGNISKGQRTLRKQGGMLYVS